MESAARSDLLSLVNYPKTGFTAPLLVRKTVNNKAAMPRRLFLKKLGNNIPRNFAKTVRNRSKAKTNFGMSVNLHIVGNLEAKRAEQVWECSLEWLDRLRAGNIYQQEREFQWDYWSTKSAAPSRF